MMSRGEGGGDPLSGDSGVVWVQLMHFGRGGVGLSWMGLHGPQQAWGPNLGGGGLGEQDHVARGLVVELPVGWDGCSGGWMVCAHFLVLSSL